jgi:hypothetical protein
MPTFNHGSVAKLLLATVDYSNVLSEAGLSQDIDTAETSALGTTAKTYVPGLTDGSFKLSGMLDTTADAALAGFKGNAAVAFDYRPQGTGTGLIKYTGNCIMTSYNISASVGDMASIDADFQVTGAITRAIQS